MKFGSEWIQDGLRHSFGTNYFNVTEDLEHLVFTRGNSIQITKRRHLRAVSKEVSENYWSLGPKA